MRRVRQPSLVEQVRSGLLDDIRGGRLAAGDKLPNEYELAEQFAVSRATVREAIQGLLETGHLARQRGNGTFVQPAPSRHALDSNVSYTAMIRDAGHEPGETVIRKGVRAATELEHTLLGLDDGESVMELERVRLADRRPVIYSRDRIRASLLEGVADEALDSSLYEILNEAGHAVVRARAELIPTLADAKLSRLLEVTRGAPLLHIDQVDYDARGRAVMLSHEWHVADAFELVVNRRISSASGDS
jgi:GntR family transcriptional regulator